MRRRNIFGIFAILSAMLVEPTFVSRSNAGGADCKIIEAPAQFPLKTARREQIARPTNSGIEPRGFVGLKGREVVHGIDISKWQPSANFEKAKECGAKFAYVRISSADNEDNELEARGHWNSARSAGLLVGPYHDLSIVDPNEMSKWSKQTASLIDANRMYAESQASLFVSEFRQRLSEDLAPPGAPLSQTALGQPYLPIVLAVTHKPRLLSDDETSRTAFGKAYGAAICAWFNKVGETSNFAGQRMILFTTPIIFHDYSLGKSPCDLSKVAIWISLRPTDGGSFLDIKDAYAKAAVSELCGDGGMNRCVIEQYTSYGEFALFGTGTSLDLDRFYGAESDLQKLLQTAKK